MLQKEQQNLKDNGIDADIVNRVEEARPNILDAIRNKQVDIVINTPTKNDSTRDGFKIRRTATNFQQKYDIFRYIKGFSRG